MEAVAAARIPGCREALGRLRDADVFEALRGLMDVEKVAEKKGGVEITYLYTPDEFTRKRLRVRFEVERGDEGLVVRGKGGLTLELTIRCNDDEAAVAAAVYKGEKYVDRRRLEGVVSTLLEKMKRLAPRPREQPTLVRPSAARQARGGGGRRECIERLITAGLAVDEELSRRIPREIHAHANVAGRVVEEGEAPTDLLDLSMYRDGFDVRIAWSDRLLETYRGGGRVGVYLRAPGAERYGRDAVEEAADELCGGRIRVFYMVLRL